MEDGISPPIFESEARDTSSSLMVGEGEISAALFKAVSRGVPTLRSDFIRSISMEKYL